MSLMPKIKQIWSSWNFNGWTQSKENISVTYWMNKLQNLSKKIFCFIKSVRKPQRFNQVIYYSHPLFDKETFKAQNEIKKLQGKKNMVLWSLFRIRVPRRRY